MTTTEQIAEDGEVLLPTTVQNHNAPAIRDEYSVAEILDHIKKIHAVMKTAMKDGHHYGVIPGTGKPSLWKPGAELICMMFRLSSKYRVERSFEGSHLTTVTTCELTHIPTGCPWGEGVGMCSTRESRYALRKASRVCPQCGKEAIIKGKDEYGGGWVCFKKKGGCGAKFDDGSQAIESQVDGMVENESLADQWNTVIKMSQKRALVAAVVNATACSDIFTQDLEDNYHGHEEQRQEPTKPEQPQQPAKRQRYQPQTKLISVDQKTELEGLAFTAGIHVMDLCAECKIDSLGELHEKNYSKLKKHLIVAAATEKWKEMIGQINTPEAASQAHIEIGEDESLSGLVEAQEHIRNLLRQYASTKKWNWDGQNYSRRGS